MIAVFVYGLWSGMCPEVLPFREGCGEPVFGRSRALKAVFGDFLLNRAFWRVCCFVTLVWVCSLRTFWCVREVSATFGGRVGVFA